MSMKRKLLKLTFALFATMVCTSVNATMYHGYCGNVDSDSGEALEDVEWYFNSVTGNLTIKIVMYNGPKAIEEYDNPTDYPWYEYAGAVKSIVIGEGITNIPDWAFAMMGHCTSITLPSTITSIGDSSLEECAYDFINLPEGLTTIENSAFTMAQIYSLTLPSTVSEIGPDAFNYCTSLSDITCLAETPPTLDLDNLPFANMDVPNIYVPAGKADIYKAADGWITYADKIQEMTATTTTFTYTAPARVNDFDNIDYFPGATSIISHDFAGGTGTVEYDGTVTAIDNYAFAGTDITSLTIPDGVVWICEGAFESCVSLEDLTIPNSVTHIGAMAVEFCSALESLTIPSSVKFIGDMAFESTGLTTLTINNGVVAIGATAFESCYDLTSLSIPNSVEIIGEAAFQYCSSLISVVLGKGVTVLCQSAFGYCESLTTVTIPSTVTTITDAFPGSNNIDDIYCFADPTIDWTVGETQNFKDGKGTRCHVEDASEWDGDALNLTFVDGSMIIEGVFVGDECWTTFYDGDKNYEVDANTTIYKANLTEDPKVVITDIGDNIICKGHAVILKSTSGPLVLTETDEEGEGDYSDNALQGSDGNVNTDANRIYCLAYMNGKLAFCRVAGGVPVPAGKAYLHLDAGARGFYVIEEDGTTAIKNMKVGKDDNIYYDLQGRRVLYPKKGLYIMNGKKVIIK